MGKTVADLTLDDEHMTVGVADTLREAAKRLLTISGGIVVVLDDDQRVKGVLGQRQLIKAMSEGVDGEAAQCHEYMEMDFMQVELKDSLKSVLADIQTRSPQAVVAVDENQEFVGYFSPGDYQEAVQLVDNLKGLNL
ncbi:MAG: CBS domain-containing protein [Candidatus Thermoplasmatota archaeon]|nr:CBS domain-containing protein [Candidatus Thermoplasmatota archaeon]|tara:strand:+ start:175 stop:585 length:411 start_codon:yes stop_codon:yes gene_type:complete